MNLIQKKINDLIKTYNTANPFKLCEYLDIKVFICKVAGNGMYHTYKRIPMIYINEDLDEHGKLLACGHELAHHLLHRKYNRVFLDNNTHFKTDKYETEADTFADSLFSIYQKDCQ